MRLTNAKRRAIIFQIFINMVTRMKNGMVKTKYFPHEYGLQAVRNHVGILSFSTTVFFFMNETFDD